MNRQRISELADFLESNPHKFYMGTFMMLPGDEGGDVNYPKDIPVIPPCGTVACVAGWAAQRWPSASNTMEAAGAYALGLTKNQAANLFYGYFSPKDDMDKITVDEVVAELRRLASLPDTAQTGEEA